MANLNNYCGGSHSLSTSRNGGGSHPFGSGSQNNLDWKAVDELMNWVTPSYALQPALSSLAPSAGTLLGQIQAQAQPRINPSWNTYQNMPSYASSTYANTLQSLLGR